MDEREFMTLQLLTQISKHQCGMIKKCFSSIFWIRNIEIVKKMLWNSSSVYFLVSYTNVWLRNKMSSCSCIRNHFYRKRYIDWRCNLYENCEIILWVKKKKENFFFVTWSLITIVVNDRRFFFSNSLSSLIKQQKDNNVKFYWQFPVGNTSKYLSI